MTKSHQSGFDLDNLLDNLLRYYDTSLGNCRYKLKQHFHRVLCTYYVFKKRIVSYLLKLTKYLDNLG